MLTYAIQRVGYNPDRTDPQGETNLISFMTAIDEFDWKQQHDLWDEEQEGPLPALVLSRDADERQLWVTSLDRFATTFLIQSVSTKEKRSFFGGKVSHEKSVDVVEMINRDAVDRLCMLFCDYRYQDVDLEVVRLRRRARISIFSSAGNDLGSESD